MSKSDYDWDVVRYKDKDFLSIIDLNRGRMSVTNNIENVVIEIEKELKQSNKVLPKFIIYRDSDNFWDGWDNNEESFIALFARSSISAMEQLIEINEKKIDVDRS